MLECGGDFVWSASAIVLSLWCSPGGAAPSGIVRSQMRPKVTAIKKNKISPMPTSLKM
jgi:hypothetical protein